MNDYTTEAREYYNTASDLYTKHQDTTYTVQNLQMAQAAALLSIAESLAKIAASQQTLALCVTRPRGEDAPPYSLVIEARG